MYIRASASYSKNDQNVITFQKCTAFLFENQLKSL